MSGFEGPLNPDEELLRNMREGLIALAASRLAEARLNEVEEDRTYVMSAPLDTPSEEALAIQLTKDGIRPFLEEADTKEQIILYFLDGTSNMIWVEEIHRDGRHTKHSLTLDGFLPTETVDDFLAASGLAEREPTAEEPAEPEVVLALPTPATSLSVLEEKLTRYLLTPQD